MQTTPKANNILGHFFALLGAVVMLAIATWVSASSSEQVKPLDNLATPRTGHTATALSDGRILITGGRDSDGHLVAASEIFNPETQTSSTSAELHTARVDHTATVLADGRVVVIGGTGASGALSSAEIFDPAHPENGFQMVGSSMSTARTRHTATLLNDGHVLIAGGDAQGSAELFDPTTGTFMPTIWPLTMARSGHTATLFTDDSVLLAGGNTATMETYTPNQGFTLDAATMSVVRTGHWAFELSDTRLLLFQGDTGNTIDEFNPSSGTITPKGSLDFHASSSSLLANGKVLVLGTDVSGLYDPNAIPPAPDFTAFDEISVPNSGILPRSGQSAVTLPGDKKILISGGVDGDNHLLGQALFNPARIWTDMDNYVPGEAVILSGSGWKPNEDVYLFAVDNINQQWTWGATVTTGADGSFVEDPAFIVQLIQQGAQFHVTAVGQSTMQADVFFTDAPRIGVVTVVNAQTGTLTYGTAGNATFSGITTQRTQNGTVNGTFTVTGLPPGATGTFVPATFTANGGNAFPNTTLTVSTTASAPAGVFNITVHCDDGNDHSTGGAATLTIGKATPTVVVTPYTCPTTTYTGLPHTATVTSITGVNGETGATVGTVNVSNTTHTAAGTYASDTWTFTGTVNYNNIGATTVTDCIAKANATVVVTPYNVIYDGNPHTATVTSITGVNGETGATVGTVNVSGTTHTTANTYNDTWTFTGTTNYNNIAATPITDIISKATPTATLAVSNSPQTYNGLGQAATVSITTSSVPGTVANILTGGSATKTNAGTYAVTADFVPTDTTNYNTLTGLSAGNFVIQKANPTAALSVTNSPVTYNGSPQAATVSISASSVPGTVANILTGGTATKTNAGTYAVTADFVPTDTTNYNTLTGLSAGNFVIQKANPTATLSVTNSPVTYDGSPQAATVSISASSVPGTVANILTGGTATKTNAGTYAVTADFVPNDTTNYNTLTGLSAGNFIIQKANATFTVTPYTCPSTTYTGLAHTATVSTITGVNGETGVTVGTVNVIDTIHTNVGIYNSDPWTFTGTANYNNTSGTVDDCIAKADATVVVTPYTCPTTTYTGLPHTATYTITGVNGETGATVGTINVSGTTHTPAGTYNNDPWSFTGGANYNDTSGTVNDCIAKANATVVVTPYTCPSTTYTGFAHTATYTISGVNSETGATVGTVDVSGTTHTNAGTYPGDAWTFTGTVNYNNTSGTVNDCIAKAVAVVVVTPYTCPTTTYTGFAHTATYTITGVNGETGATVGGVNVSGTSHTAAGTYNNDPWSFTGTANYEDQNGTVNDCIAKAVAVVVVTPYTCPTTTYTGFAHTATYTINGVNGESGATVGAVNVSGTSHTAAGTYNNDPWSFTGTANYEDQNGTVNDCIAKAAAVVVVTPYTCPTTTYTGFAHTATYTINGVNGESGATVGAVNVSGTSHTAAGTYNNDPWSFTGTANYEDQNGTVNDCIAKADATFTVTAYSVTYNGNPHTATVSTITGVNGETGATVGAVNVSGTIHTDAGTYNNDPWSFTGTANYNNQSGTVDDYIGKADATFTVTAYSVTYNGNPHTASVSTITGVNGETGATVGAVNVTGTIHTDAGTYNNDPWSFTGTANYNNQSGTVDDYIGKADATFTVTAYSVTYNGNPHTATVSTITGVNGETGATVGAVNVSGTIHTDAGTYNNDPWSFTGTANYNNQSGTVDDYIGKADATFTVTAYSVTYNGNPHTATVSTITGVNGETGATVGAVNVTGTIHTDAGTYNNDPWSFTGTANYNNQSGTVDDYIGKADATFTVTAYSVTYNGNPHTATVSTITGVNGETGATVGAVNVSGTIHTDAGTYNNDPWSFTGTANYNNQNGTVNDYIGKADATFTVTAYSVTYNGNPHTATVSTITGVNGETGATVGAVNVTGTIHTDAGTYNNDPWSFTGTANYNNQSGTVDDYIDRANATVVVAAYTCPTTTYTGLPHTATVVSITGVNGETGATVGTVDVSNTTHTNVGTYAADYWFFTGAANYNNIGNTMITDCIAKANATVVVAAYTCPTTIYNANTHTATVVSITGVNGETGATVGTVNVSNTTHTNAATYASDYWFFTGTANYNNIGNTTITDCIAKASTTTTITSDNPDPSIIGQAYTVHWTVSPQISGTPTGTVTVSDGTASCSAAVSGFCNLTSTTAGPKTLTATYSGDANFLTGSDTESHNVSYTFIGFFPPIDNIPVLNQVKAGQTIPVKWQLKDYAGNIICDLSSLAPNGLNSVRINCDSNEPIDDIEELAPPGGTVFRCDGTQFIYNWQTTKSWAGTCRQLQVTLADGHTYVANFKFK